MKRNQDGTLKESVDVGKSLAADRRSIKENGKAEIRRPGRPTQAVRHKVNEEVDKKVTPRAFEPMLATPYSTPFPREGLVVRTKVGWVQSDLFPSRRQDTIDPTGRDLWEERARTVVS